MTLTGSGAKNSAAHKTAEKCLRSKNFITEFHGEKERNIKLRVPPWFNILLGQSPVRHGEPIKKNQTYMQNKVRLMGNNNRRSVKER
jgi:hypothetical protein